MIIVSQDRKFISENLEIGVIPIYDEEEFENGNDVIVGYKVENDYVELGTYKTEERAKEVLQEIIQNIYPKSNVDMDIYGISFGVQSPVYEMPLE